MSKIIFCKLVIMLAPMVLLMSSCGEKDHTVPDYGLSGDKKPPVNLPEPDEMYSWELSRDGLLDYTDMVLLYGGGRQRYIANWDNDRLASYVSYKDQAGVETWFFDSFLFIEFADYGAGSAMVTYATGYKDPVTGRILDSATKSDWARLIDYFFLEGHNLAALDETIGNVAARIGKPLKKQRVVITIPEPIVRMNSSVTGSPTVYWGEVDGRSLDFSNSADRVEACHWYIDRVRACFNDCAYKNIELAGFYWVAEKSTDSSTILTAVGDYLNSMNYTFNWIPYFSAQGYAQWEKWGFNYAYLQPNYFFNDATPLSRLDEACNMAISAKMGMEMEFDDNALASNGRGYKLRNYMDAFRRYRIWDERRIAYYQGNNTVHTLKNSSNAEDRALYHEFAKFVVTRPLRSRGEKMQ